MCICSPHHFMGDDTNDVGHWMEDLSPPPCPAMRGTNGLVVRKKSEEVGQVHNTANILPLALVSGSSVTWCQHRQLGDWPGGTE